MRILYHARKITLQTAGVGYVIKRLLQELSTYKDLEIITSTKIRLLQSYLNSTKITGSKLQLLLYGKFAQNRDIKINLEKKKPICINILAKKLIPEFY